MTLTAPVETAVSDAYESWVSMLVCVVLCMAVLPLLLKTLEEVHCVGEGEWLGSSLLQVILINDVTILEDWEEGQGGVNQYGMKSQQGQERWGSAQGHGWD